MTTVANADPKRMYSWWWDSHISPKNSKWLQENLTDTDSKVKQMIKLIEEDADSFARRAEMYYKKRPELMKMVEDFYRAYRALAERYDHATGVLRQAHRTMAEAFPNQVPVLGDDSPASSGSDSDPRTPEMLGLSSSQFHATQRNGAFTEQPDTVPTRKGFKQFNDLNNAKFAEGRARKGLNFFDSEEKKGSMQNNRSQEAETEIMALKNALAKLESEKEAGLLLYQQNVERLSNLESEVSRAQEDSRGLNERASKAESEVQTLKEVLAKLEAERKASLLQYENCLEKISNLENSISHAQKDAGELNKRASDAENEAESLKQELDVLEAEKEAALVQYKECLEMTLNLEDKLCHAEEDARRMSERADKAEGEVETLKQAISKLTEEKEAAALQYQQCLELVSSLEHKIACAQEESKRLNCELDNGVAKLKDAEEKCCILEKSNQNLHSELESVVQRMGTQSQELTEKEKELGRLWTCIQEERFRYMEAETAFQTLQHLHSQSQEELGTLLAELQHRAQILKDMETHSQGLQDEIQKVTEENKGLNKKNASSAFSIENLEAEILSLKETVRKLEAEVELRVDQRNALQQEIYCLKEELNDLNKKHQAVLEQVGYAGLDPECFGSSVKVLQEENSELKEICERDKADKAVLQEKLEHMEKLLVKNTILEDSLLSLNVELEAARGRVRALEESCECLLREKSSLLAEKDALISLLQVTTKNMQKLSDKKNLLENSLFDANAELEGLRVKSKSLEDSCLLLNNEKSGLMVEKEQLVSQVDITQQRLEDLEKSHAELNEKYLDLENERVTILSRLEELQVSLDAEKQEHASFAELTGTQLAGMASQIRLLQEEGWHRKNEFGEQLDKSVGAQIEIFILQEYVKELGDKNFTLLNEYNKLLETSKLSEKLISELEHENQEHQLEANSLIGRIQLLLRGLYHVSKTLNIGISYEFDDKNDIDVAYLNNVLGKLEETQDTISKTCDENQQLILEKSVLQTLLEQLRLEAGNLVSERNVLNQEFSIKSEQFLLLQGKAHKLAEVNEELRLKVKDGHLKEGLLKVELESLRGNQCSLEEAYQNLQNKNSKVCEEKRSLIKELSIIKECRCALEEESFVLIGENMSQDVLSVILKNIISEKSMELKELGKNIEELEDVNIDLEEKVKKRKVQLEVVQTENLYLTESLEKSEVELRLVRSVSDQLANQIANGKDQLCKKENELLEVEQKLNAALNERTELVAIVEDLKREYDEVRVIQENQEKQIMELSEDRGHQRKEIELISEANQRLEAELCALDLEHEETKFRENCLGDELEKERNEVELWETQAAAFFSELQTSVVHKMLFEDKIHELAEACQSLKDTSNTKDIEIKMLKEKVCFLEDRNEGLNDQLAVYIPTIISLKNCVTSLENHTILRTELQKEKDGKLFCHPHAEAYPHESKNPISTVHDGISNLQDLETRIKAVEEAVGEMERLAMMEHIETNAKLEVAMRQLEELKSGSMSKRGNTRTRKNSTIKHEEGLRNGPSSDRHLQNPVPEISELRSEVLTKDIVLDQISGGSSYGISKRENGGADHMHELWGTTDQEGSIDLMMGMPGKLTTAPVEYYKKQASKGHKSDYPSAESLSEKELGVDKLETSKRFTEARQEGNKKKVLERLNSDAQKLTNLQITVQDLKSKVEITEKSKNGKGIEYDSVKEQLEETDESILKLFDANRKLMKDIEDGKLAKNADYGSFSSEGKSTMEPDESGSVKRRRIVEQARRGSEKIGRLQLEVQKIQFLLLKLTDEKENKQRTRITERNTRVRLHDYLYGTGRTNNQKKKKAHFCACARPSARGDSDN